MSTETIAGPMPDRMTTSALALGSVAIGLLVLGLKFAAYWATGSVALFSDALESIVNVTTSLAALVAVRFSAKPADASHPYGHHKAEYFSVVLEGVLIVVAAIAVFREAYVVWLLPRTINEPVLGLLLNGVATAINGGWCWLLISQGRRRRSPALVADGKHLFADVLSSVGAFGGVVLAVVTGIAVIDPIVAALVALNILWSGWALIRESMSGLMDAAVPDDILERIRQVISANATGALEAHALRTRQAGRMTFIDFHLVVPGTMSVSTAHGICDQIEQALRAEIADCLITIHVEPEDKAKHHGVLVL
jgi:cation diffusion facilitator family transporter